ncbi:hypothetical protein OFC17_31825, partial [Escherichia coli]|nr:hypothetical protein [Escherichia coli]
VAGKCLLCGHCWITLPSAISRWMRTDSNAVVQGLYVSSKRNITGPRPSYSTNKNALHMQGVLYS